MAEYKVTPTAIEWKRSYEGRYGEIHVFTIDAENEDGTPVSGIFTTTKQNQDKFKIGKQVLVTFKKAEEDHEQIWKFDIITDKKSGSGGYGAKGNNRNDPVVQRSILINVCDHAAMALLKYSGKGDLVKDDMAGINTLSKKIFDHIHSKAGNDTQMAITYQAQVKLICEYFPSFPGVAMDNSTKMLQLLDDRVQRVIDISKSK